MLIFVVSDHLSIDLERSIADYARLIDVLLLRDLP